MGPLEKSQVRPVCSPATPQEAPGTGPGTERGPSECARQMSEGQPGPGVGRGGDVVSEHQAMLTKGRASEAEVSLGPVAPSEAPGDRMLVCESSVVTWSLE